MSPQMTEMMIMPPTTLNSVALITQRKTIVFYKSCSLLYNWYCVHRNAFDPVLTTRHSRAADGLLWISTASDSGDLLLPNACHPLRTRVEIYASDLASWPKASYRLVLIWNANCGTLIYLCPLWITLSSCNVRSIGEASQLDDVGCQFGTQIHAESESESESLCTWTLEFQVPIVRELHWECIRVMNYDPTSRRTLWANSVNDSPVYKASDSSTCAWLVPARGAGRWETQIQRKNCIVSNISCTDKCLAFDVQVNLPWRASTKRGSLWGTFRSSRLFALQPSIGQNAIALNVSVITLGNTRKRLHSSCGIKQTVVCSSCYLYMAFWDAVPRADPLGSTSCVPTHDFRILSRCSILWSSQVLDNPRIDSLRGVAIDPWCSIKRDDVVHKCLLRLLQAH